MMTRVKVRAFARFRELFGDAFEVSVPAPPTLGAVVHAVGERNRDGLLELFDGEQRVKRSVILLVNRERITGDDREGRQLADGDEVAIYPPVAGG